MRRLLVACVVALVAGVAAGGTAGGQSGPWVIRDLGTLGGPNSQALSINDRGQVVGFSETRKTDEHGLKLNRVFLWEKGRMRDLGPIDPVPGESVIAISERGVVIWTTPDNRAVAWRNGTMTRLIDRESTAIAINVRGTVVGAVARAGLWYPVLWAGKRMVELGKWPGSATDLNDRGQVVGTNRCSIEPPNWGHPGAGCRAFLWHKGKLRDIGTLGGREGVAVAINDRGQVVGASTTKNSCTMDADFPECGGRAFLWDGGRIINLGTLGGTWSRAFALNRHGQVVADSGLGHENGVEEAWASFIWDRGKRTAFRCRQHSVDPEQCSLSDINDQGWSVGGSFATPMAWHNRTPTWLPKLRASSSSGGEAAAINNHGQIVGWAETKTGDRHAVVWTQRG